MSNTQQTTNTTLRQMMDTGVIGASILATPQVAKGSYYGKSIMDYITNDPLHIKIHKVANGFVIQSAEREGDRTTAHVATTVEELHEIITTQLVTKKLEGK